MTKRLVPAAGTVRAGPTNSPNNMGRGAKMTRPGMGE